MKLVEENFIGDLGIVTTTIFDKAAFEQHVMKYLAF